MSTTDTQEIKEQLDEMASIQKQMQDQMNSVLDLLRGNKLNPNDEGLLGDVRSQGAQIRAIKADVDVLLEDKRRWKWALGRVAVGFGVVVGIVQFIFNYLIKK
jgi:hypothetical protein